MKTKIILGGAGTLYPVHLGGVIKLAETGHEIEAVCASSSSAIVAATIASGYKLNQEMVQVTKETLLAKHKLSGPSYYTLWRKGGLQKTQKLEKALGKYFVHTLGEAKIPLSLVAYNVTKAKHVVFSSEKNPEMPLAQALRAAMSTPILFAPTEINGDLYVDGAVSTDFPFDIFGDGPEVLCIRPHTKKAPVAKPANNKLYLTSMLEQMIKSSLEARGSAKRTVLIESQQGCLDFNITDAEVDKMVVEGYKGLEEWLAR